KWRPPGRLVRLTTPLESSVSGCGECEPAITQSACRRIPAEVRPPPLWLNPKRRFLCPPGSWRNQTRQDFGNCAAHKVSPKSAAALHIGKYASGQPAHLLLIRLP